MKQQLQEILNTLYEAEGLLEMALRRGENSYATLAELARSKCYHAADLAAALDIRHEEEPAPETREEEDDAVKLFEEKIVPQLDAELAEATEQEAEDMASANPEPEPAQEPEEKPMEEPAPEPAEEPEPDATPAEEIEQMQAEVPMPEDREGEREIANASIFEMEEEADAPEDSETSEFSEDSEEAEEAEAPEETPRAPRNRRPIATFFSINDKFRFRRELFANNNREWLDALALLEAMDNMEEARDYLFDDLQWEADNAEVKAFISVLDRYYKS